MKAKEIANQYKKRINELQEKLDEPSLLPEKDNEDRTIVESCYVGTLSIITSLYGSNSTQAKVFMDLKKSFKKTSYSSIFEINSLKESVRGTLINIREELDQGLIRNIATEAAGEVIGDLLSLAKEELKAGYINVAAVLATAALEDALKKKAEEMGLIVRNKPLDSVINALKSKSFFKGAQVPIVSSYVKLRNTAMHAEWDKIKDSDVNSLIGFLEPFLLEHFS